jgi:hypothetical protein
MIKEISNMAKYENHAQRRSEKEKPRPDSLIREKDLEFAERLRLFKVEMKKCLEEDKAIDLSTLPHKMITMALHSLVYEQGEEKYLKITYGDGAEKKFPVRSLRLPNPAPFWNEAQAFNVSTLTFRHVVYDKFVDFYLVRDRETRRSNSSQNHDEAHKRMKELLSDPDFEGDTYLALFHTGLEPLVVGAYQAVVEHLKERSARGLGRLIVRPVYFANEHKMETGQFWVA